MARSVARSLGGLLLTVALVGVAAPGAHAQTVVRATWPAVEVEPGSEVTIPLEVASVGHQRAALEVVEVPERWEALLRGGGFVVHGVMPTEDGTRVELQLTVPADAPEGLHRVVVRATADGVVDDLVVELLVTEEVAGAVTFDVEFPRISGAADSTFRWSLELASALPGETTFALEASGPSGWLVQARPSSEQRATTVTLAGGDTETIQVTAEPPVNVAAGPYEITVVASGGGQRLEVPLVAEVEGQTALRLTTADERLNAAGSAGRPARVALLVTNTGSSPIQELRLRSDPPVGWDVTFEPEEPAPIAPGESAEITAVIVPADDAITGDYALGLTAEADGRESAVEIRFQVRTPVGWGLVGVAVIAAAIVGLLLVFRRYGRR
jgi:uncharacterized membrane protein